MESQHLAQDSLRILHYVSPAITLAYYCTAHLISFCTLQGLKGSCQHTQRKPIIGLQSAVLAMYAIEALVLIITTLLDDTGDASADNNIYALFEVFLWTVMTATLSESQNVGWYPFYGSWMISLVTELVLFVLNIPPSTSYRTEAPSLLKHVRLLLQSVRLLLLVLLLLLYFHQSVKSRAEEDEESTLLLRADDLSSVKNAVQGISTYGAAQSAANKCVEDDDDSEAGSGPEDKAKEEQLKRLQESGNWIRYLSGFSIFASLVWPSGRISIYLSIIGVILSLLAGRILNLLVPRQLGIVIDSLPNDMAGKGSFPGIQVGLLVLYRLLASDRIIGELESILWIPFGQHAEKRIKTAAHEKVLELSRDFQTRKSTGEVIRSIDQGMTVVWLFRILLIHILPTGLDMLVSGIYLSHVFGTYMSLVLAATALLYLWLSIHLNTKRVKPQRDVLGKDRKEAQVLYESVGEWDSVSYFGTQSHESRKFSKSIDIRLLAEFKSRWLAMQSSVSEEFVIQLGFAGAALLSAYEIVHGNQKVGSFAMMVFYYVIAAGHLSSISYLGSSLLTHLLEAEMLRDLLLTQPSVQNGPEHFRFYRGAVLFNEVTFSYDGKSMIIRDFNFSAEAGQRIALVGETGAGKTTMLRLLFRFYDVTAGKIMIDGQDIRDVTLESLRNCIGVVPQDPSLFNSTIMENVRYSRMDASDEEVIEACKSAAIHDDIVTYTNGYATEVGERGIKLSGGELQRIAIARVMLKNSKIVLLDEATSSVDSATEALIQTALQSLTRGRTTFTVAHRLSTIKDSDVILVMNGGTIVEQGSPSKLLRAGGRFSSLWKCQFGIESEGYDEMEGTKGIDNAAKEPISEASAILAEEGRPTSRHIAERSASSFRPDAPEFVPHYQRSTEASNGQSSHTHPGAGHQQSHKDTLAHSPSQKFLGGKHDRGISRLKKREQKVESNGTPANGSVESCVAAIVSKYDGPAGDIKPTAETPMTPKPQRLNRWQRRRLARSEPQGSSFSSQANGTSEDRNEDESEELAAARRVSGPGRFPSTTVPEKDTEGPPSAAKETSQNQRHRRPRRFRTKKQHEQSTSGSGQVSAER